MSHARAMWHYLRRNPVELYWMIYRKRAMTEPTLPTDTDAVRAEKLDAQNVRLLKRIVAADAEVVALKRTITNAPHANDCPVRTDAMAHCNCWKAKVIL